MCAFGVRLRRDEGRVRFYANMLLCLLRRRIGRVEPCNTITACSFSQSMKARQYIPERPSSGAADTLVLAEMKDVCGTGDEAAGWCERDARKGFPDDILEVKSNTLFYVHDMEKAWTEAVWRSCCVRQLALMVVGVWHISAPTAIRETAVTAKSPTNVQHACLDASPRGRQIKSGSRGTIPVL